ncbi:hypothetical protein EYF80_006239 [Liparis tanakae]|uniref:Uncharacterized protein n=1 Tax=Liparis tanakae TaxID=230148 RepID=A0A4Z2J0Q6_9TELE|nr:hypothetical protein EYF80_006239 [Liparis tanakae]
MERRAPAHYLVNQTMKRQSGANKEIHAATVVGESGGGFTKRRRAALNGRVDGEEPPLGRRREIEDYLPFHCVSGQMLYSIVVFNVYFSVVNFWLSSHIWLFRLVSSQLIGSASRSDPARCSPQHHVTLSLRVT